MDTSMGDFHPRHAVKAKQISEQINNAIRWKAEVKTLKPPSPKIDHESAPTKGRRLDLTAPFGEHDGI